MMKVLIIAPSNKGTIALRSMDLYKAFKKRDDIDTRVVFLHKYIDGFDIGDNEYCDLYTNSPFTKFFKLFKEIWWIRKKKKKINPDITISTLIACTVCNVLSFTKEFKIGLFRAPYEQNIRSISFFHRLFHPWVFSQLDKLVGVSEEVTNSIKIHFPQIPAKKFSTIYNTFFVDEIRHKQYELLDVDEREIFKNPVILYVCRLNTLKAPQRLIQAFALSNVKGKYCLVFVGADSENRLEELTTMACRLGVGERVHFLGAKRNPYKYMRNASFFASSSITEGLPGVLIESLLVGTPVITTNSSYGVWEVLSCSDSYRKDLDGLFVADNGIITANTSDEKQTVNSLVDALNVMEEYDFRAHPFVFESKIKPDDIVNSYLSLFYNNANTSAD